MEKFILAIDQGTSSSRALIFDHEGRIRSLAQKEFRQHFPKEGWVEHDPMQIWHNTVQVVKNLVEKAGIDKNELAVLGISKEQGDAFFLFVKIGRAHV